MDGLTEFWLDKQLKFQNKRDSLTKLDVLDELDELKICVGYELNGTKIDYLPAATEDQFNIKPIYETFPGWNVKLKV